MKPNAIVKWGERQKKSEKKEEGERGGVRGRGGGEREIEREVEREGEGERERLRGMDDANFFHVTAFSYHDCVLYSAYVSMR